MAIALLSATLLALAARRLGLLTNSGVVAAAMVGAAAVHAGVDWVVLLLVFFASSNLLSHWRSAERDARTAGFVGKGARRDARQVIANGGVFGLAALASTWGDAVVWSAVGAGAIAAATADTWSTEVGTVSGQTPRLVLSGRAVPAGTSGAITPAGTAAAVCGAVLAAFLAQCLDWGVPVLSTAAGGLGGSLADSILGAAIQERRWCDACSALTEQRMHRCGAATRHRGGIRGLDNDMVNLLSTIAGAAITWWLV